MAEWHEEDGRYQVVVNHEEQYSIWKADLELAPGWRAEGFVGSKAECVARIEEIWTDLPPLSARHKMRELERQLREEKRDRNSG